MNENNFDITDTEFYEILHNKEVLTPALQGFISSQLLSNLERDEIARLLSVAGRLDLMGEDNSPESSVAKLLADLSPQGFLALWDAYNRHRLGELDVAEAMAAVRESQ